MRSFTTLYRSIIPPARFLSFASLILTLAGCSTTRDLRAAAFFDELNREIQSNRSRSDTTELLLFTGASHAVFRGCIRCDHFDNRSICNYYGKYGSQFSSDSIWNQFGACSKFNLDSPWNSVSSNLVIVDEAGNYYGRLTINPLENNQFANYIRRLHQAHGGDLTKIRDVVCEK